MATEAIFSVIFASCRRRQSPSLEAFLAPVHLSDVTLVRTLASISSEVVSCFRDVSFSFQRRNSRSLIRKIAVFVVLFEYLADSGLDCDSSLVSSTAVLCFNDLYLLLHRSKFLLHYCAHSSKLWLLLQNPSLSDFFHVLNRDILTLLDVFPVDNLGLSYDIREQIELLHKQSSKSSLFVDNNDEMLRDRFYTFLDGFGNGQIPNSEELRCFFVEKLGIGDAKSCKAEIEFLEQQIVSNYCDSEPTRSVINSFVDITRYCMFLLYELEDKWRIENTKKQRKSLIAQEIEDMFIEVPHDFVCSISLSLMKDPVIVSTGQTYDRSSIARWFGEGHRTCPKTGQKLVDSCIVPNRALRNLIRLWCAATDFSHESEFADSQESPASVFQTRASMEANKATVKTLIQNLADGSELAQAMAARDIRFLAKTVSETRTLLAEAGAIPHLRRLLKSENAIAQENSITAIFNLATHEINKSRVMEENDCLESIVSVLVSGLTMEARGNAAATLYSLSRHGYETKIASANGCIESLALLVQNGTLRGKKDAMNALYSIWSHPDNYSRMVNLGGVSALVGALADEDVAERAAGVLYAVAYQSLGAETIGKEESAVAGLMEVMRRGTPRGKENAVATLLHLCINGGAVMEEKVVRAPALSDLTQKLLLTGTDRAKRKAASLAQVLKRCQNTTTMRSGDREGSFRTNVSVPISIPVSVL